MADDKHYVPGDFYRIDDKTGFKVRANRTRKEWTNMIVRDQSFEYRQPQDFVRGVIDDQNVPEPRPRQHDVFINQNIEQQAMFVVYGDSSVSKQFLVQNAMGPAYDPGQNSDYLNLSTQGASIQSINGTDPVIQADEFPANGQFAS